METLKALDVIMKLEDSLRETYEGLCDRYAKDDEDLSAFFYNLSLDEKSHMDIVAMQRRIVRDSAQLFRSDIELAMKEISLIMGLCAQLAADKSASARDVLVTTCDIESNSAELYAYTALQKSNESLAQFLVNLSKTFTAHAEAVQAFAGKRGIEVSTLDKYKAKFTRIPFNGVVLINKQVRARAIDISQGGMYITTTRSYSPGDKVVIDFNVRDKSFSVKAAVMFHVDGVGIGVMFEDLPQEASLIIKAHVELFLTRQQTKARVKKILLVGEAGEADIILKFYRSEFMRSRFKLATVSGFTQGVAALNDKLAVDAIIICMGEVEDDNFKLVQYIKSNESIRDIPIIVLTHNYSGHVRSALMEAGAHLVLQKMSTTPQKMAEAITSVLNL